MAHRKEIGRPHETKTASAERTSSLQITLKYVKMKNATSYWKTFSIGDGLLMLVNTVIKDRIAYAKMQDGKHFNCLSGNMCHELMDAIEDSYAKECVDGTVWGGNRRSIPSPAPPQQHAVRQRHQAAVPRPLTGRRPQRGNLRAHQRLSPFRVPWRRLQGRHPRLPRKAQAEL